jgi:glucose/arabinose dehydrogenase
MRVLPAALLLSACGVGAGGAQLTWVAKPSFNAGGQQPNPVQPQPPNAGGSSSTPRSSAAATADPSIVATRLTTPDAIAVLPDNTALVGERTTGRIVRVQPLPGQPVQVVRTLAGVDGAADGGLLDLALSPSYAEDGLVFALITTVADLRVVDFTLTGPVTAVFTGIPRGATGRLAFGEDGRLYIGTSDAGQPGLAGNPASLLGKVLRVTDVGTPARGNPAAGSPVFTRGHHAVAGLCLYPGTNQLLEVEPRGSDPTVEVNLLVGGDEYGWPARTSSSQGPITTLPAGQTAPSGSAVLNSTLYVTSRDGQDLLAAPLGAKGGTLSAGTFTAMLTHKYGRLNTVVAAADGALWLTTSNRDGHGKPVRDDERVLRIVPTSGAANTPV